MTHPDDRRIVLIDPDPETRAVYSARLRSHDFVVDEAADAVRGAEMALASPPMVVVSDLWMPGVSGVQLCRLLKAEPGTAHVPVILRAEHEDPRSRFWATRAGALTLVSKDRMGDLMRALATAAAASSAQAQEFFFEMSGGMEVRDRIAQHLDRALFESVIASEVRALASACSFGRLFDSLSQLLAQLVTYRWMAVSTNAGDVAVHAHRRSADECEKEARAALGVGERTKAVRILDADAAFAPPGGRVIALDISLGDVPVGRVAMSVVDGDVHAEEIAAICASELGGALRLVTLIEESQRLATTDALTQLHNRRAFGDMMEREISRCDRSDSPMSVMLFDLDHFKSINDTRGHAGGDLVLAAVGKLLRHQARGHDIVARWGGEEFVIGLPGELESGGKSAAERIRAAIERLDVRDAAGERIPVSASIGVVERTRYETLEATVDRADRTMYCAKLAGRNRVCLASEHLPASADPSPAEDMAA
ncbi:MAG: hypothetical protein JWP97_5316 [Labilithrix sp.]|nr:hypothetical protein [Labilithrix sp.]